MLKLTINSLKNDSNEKDITNLCEFMKII